MSETKKLEYQSATKNDTELKEIIHYLKTQWPNCKSDRHDFVSHYYKLKDELITTEDLLFFKNRLVIPKSLRTEVLNKLHEGHLGREKIKARARELLYWPKMSKEIEEHCSKCKICETHARKNVRELLKPLQVPERPWKRVGTDIFSYAGKIYLVIVDAYSSLVGSKC